MATSCDAPTGVFMQSVGDSSGSLAGAGFDFAGRSAVLFPMRDSGEALRPADLTVPDGKEAGPENPVCLLPAGRVQ